MIKTTLKGALACALLTTIASARTVKEDSLIILSSDINFTIPSVIKPVTSPDGLAVAAMKEQFKSSFIDSNLNKNHDAGFLEDVIVYDLGKIKNFEIQGIRYLLKKDSNGNRYIFPDFSIFTQDGLAVNNLSLIGEKISVTDSVQTLLLVDNFYRIMENQKDQIVYFNAKEDDDLDTITFIDPSCPHCVKHLNDIKPNIDAGTLKTAIVFTGILGEDSVKKSAYILSKLHAIEDDKQRYAKLLSLVNRLNAGGTPDDFDAVDQKYVDRIKEAEVQWDLLGINSVPKSIPLKVIK